MNEPELVKICRTVISEKSFRTVDDKTGALLAKEYGEDCASIRQDSAVILDMNTANMVVTVYDALSYANRSKFPELLAKHGCSKLIEKLWKLVK